MGRFDDDLHLVPADEFVPTLVHTLFRMEGVVDAPHDVKADVIRKWLASNEPTPMMEFSIRKDGFGDLLPPRS